MDRDSSRSGKPEDQAQASTPRASRLKILLVLTLPFLTWGMICAFNLSRINKVSLPWVTTTFSPRATLAERLAVYGRMMVTSVRISALLTEAKLYNKHHNVPYRPESRYGAYIVNTGGNKKFLFSWGYFDWDADGFGEADSLWPVSGDAILLRGVPKPGGKVDGRDLLLPSTEAPWQPLYNLDANGDRRLDKQDDAFIDLMMWTDKNLNGKVDREELYPFSYLVSAIDLSGEAPKTEPVMNEPFDSKKLEPGSKLDVVFFNYDETNTQWLDTDLPTDLEDELAALPDLRGYGSMPDLRFAMAKNKKLRALVEKFNATPGIDLLMNVDATDAMVRDILFTWAGVEDIPEGSRGPVVDARVVGYLENVAGERFYQIKRYYHPLAFGGRSLKEAWDIAFRHARASLLAQTDASRLFVHVKYDVKRDKLIADGQLNRGGLMTDLKTRLKQTDYKTRASVWNRVQDLITIAYGGPAIVTEDKMFTRR